ncbi:MAG: T9SS type A sorting domain-containing protein [Bacteroidales bacterium]|nr:T9SS type A sorting domain-containing protein [Bacteroidales bacterium]
MCIIFQTINAQEKDTISLPFFDDFSYGEGKVNSLLWEKSGVNISNSLPINPPSIGAATFDALDADGNFYPSNYGIKYCNGDTLTSKPIDLYYPGDNTVFLSFFYQAGGLGDAPENTDSLLLDFYDPIDKEWITIKSFAGSNNKQFNQEIISISQKCYLQKGFKFRFRNLFSLGSSLQPDLVSNCDYWLVDYVKLDCLRSIADTVYQDVALTNCPSINFNNYSSIPYKHYLQKKNEINISYNIFYKNNDVNKRLLDSINLYFEGEGDNNKLLLGSYNLPSLWDFSESKDFKYTFNSINGNTANYKIGVKLVSDVSEQDYYPNNTYYSEKILSDYYAYDDGTAEAGYGIHGEGTKGGYVAVKYISLINDNLNGVYLYFNQTYKNKQADYFTLKVWDCLNGIPNNELYSQENLLIPKDKYGQFVYFKFNNSVAVTDTFFIGWQKVETEILNIGFDKSVSSAANNNYYNINGQWKKSTEKGNIMIRPSIGHISTPIAFELKTKHDLSVFPNPTTQYIKIFCEEISYPTKILIYNTIGKQIKSEYIYDSEEEIDVSDLPNGFYLLQIPEYGISNKFIKK